MDAGITTEFDPLLFARSGKQISGVLSLKELPRLAGLSNASAKGCINIELQFSCDEDQQYWMQGRAEGQIEVICQRCLEQMPLKLESKILTSLVRQSKESLAEAQETDLKEDQVNAQIVCKGKTTVAALIEDDLLLAIPMFPKHSGDDCGNKIVSAGNVKKITEQVEAKKENPFAVLATLKTNKKAGKKVIKKSKKK